MEFDFSGSREKLSDCQREALSLLESDHNVFVTGIAGSGKSYLIREFLRHKDPKEYPIVATTGAAAILVGGRTFHSFFGLGILEGGVERTVENALRQSRVKKRLKEARAVVIDEASMLSPEMLEAAEWISRAARKREEPWGGLRIIAVGDFAQLPPIVQGRRERSWAFEHPVWQESQFVPAVLRTPFRTEDRSFLDVLNEVRQGDVSESVVDFLNDRAAAFDGDVTGTRLFPRKDLTEKFNLARLGELAGTEDTYETSYSGNKRAIEQLKRQAPIPDVLRLKERALVMLRQNDPIGRWVNGSLGTVKGMTKKQELEIELLTGKTVKVDRAVFSLCDADGEPIATATNYPVNLAWATTIHKAQGATFDRLCVNLTNLWEPGHAYVALSRVRSADGLFVEGWNPRSIKADPRVSAFHREIGLNQ